MRRCVCFLLIFVWLVPAWGWARGKSLDELLADAEDLIVITASKHEQKLIEVPVSVSVITREHIENSAAETVYDLLQSIPGVDTKNTSYYKYDINIRCGTSGTRTARVLFLINGIPINSPYNGFFEVSRGLSLINIERIEIVRTPGSSLYGANAYSGIVNIITKKAGEFEGVSGSILYGSYNRKNYSLMIGEKRGDLSLLFSGNWFDTDGPQGYKNKNSASYVDTTQYGLEIAPGSGLTPADPNDNMYADAFDMTGELRYRSFTLFANYNEYRRPEVTPDILDTIHTVVVNPNQGAPLPVVYYKGPFANGHAVKKRLFIDGRFHYGVTEDLNIMVRAHWFEHRENRKFSTGTWDPYRDAMEPRGLPTKYVYSEKEEETKNKSNLYLGEFQANHKFSDRLMTVGGLEYRYSDARSDAFEDKNKIHHRTNFAGYLESQFRPIESWILAGGVRYDHNSKYDNEVSPRLSSVYNFLPEAAFRLTYSQAFRAPSFTNLNLFMDVGVFSIYGDQDMKPEKIKTFEAALSYNNFEYLKSNFICFYTLQKDLIVYRREESEGVGDLIIQNFSEIVLKGIELDLQSPISDKLNLYLNYAYQKTVYGDTEDTRLEDPDADNSFKDVAVEYAPEHNVNFGFTFRPIEKLSLRLDGHFISETLYYDYEDTDGDRYNDTRHEKKLDGYFLLGTKLRANIYSNYFLSFSVINLTDENQEVEIGSPMRDRQYTVSLDFNF
ncbi:MAG: hypothetical protein B6244_02050 [Candidatus Cloacimonetes bacterium 4572_55]|nr:MAG: hypothetical protein B6244_02050 [Candidatus Cloacimonetes bacterium 4572_55]